MTRSIISSSYLPPKVNHLCKMITLSTKYSSHIWLIEIQWWVGLSKFIYSSMQFHHVDELMQLATVNKKKRSNTRLDAPSFFSSLLSYQIIQSRGTREAHISLRNVWLRRTLIPSIEKWIFWRDLTNSLKRHLSNMSRFIDDSINTYFMFLWHRSHH